jgi:hypothetical protein
MAHAHPGSARGGLADCLDHRAEFVSALPGSEQIAFGTLPVPLDPAEFGRPPGEPGLLRVLELTAMSVSR